MYRYFIRIAIVSLFFLTSYSNAQEPKPSGHSEGFNAAYKMCESESNMSSNFDCECLAAKAEALHSKQNPGEPIEQHLNYYFSVIGQEISCYDLSKVKYRQNGGCMKAPMWGKYAERLNITREDFCEFYAETYTKFFSEFEGKIDGNTSHNIGRKTLSYCKRPENYKKN